MLYGFYATISFAETGCRGSRWPHRQRFPEYRFYPIEFPQKKENGLDFFGRWCKLAIGIVLQRIEDVDSKFISIVVLTKECVNLPGFCISLDLVAK